MLVTPTPVLTPTPDFAQLAARVAELQAAQFNWSVFVGAVLIGLLILLVMRR